MPEGTLQSLGKKVARRLQKCDRRIERIPLPTFTDSLSPLNDFIDEVLEVIPQSRFLLLLDEFDELPLDLYKRGPVGDGFFLTIRALSGRPRIGLILIGGEKMGPIISAQGDQLNRFQPLRIDYFRREEHWSDFEDLVRKPVENQIEFSEGAVETIYRWSAGNPFFTNVICGEVLRHCCDRRDSFVSELEAEQCAAQACENAGANSFAHFWEDGILATGVDTEDVSIRRRKVLLASAGALRAGKSCSREENAAYVHSSEILRLVDNWGGCSHGNVAEERVRAWLCQFESNKDQRVMFQILRSLRFYTEAKD